MRRPAAVMRLVKDDEIASLGNGDERARTEGAAGVSLIATTDPDLFLPRFTEELGTSVHIFDSGAAVVAALTAEPCARLFADYRQLADRWYGQRLLKHVRERADFAHIDVFLMADHWQSHQEQWAKKLGSAGMVRRSPDSVAARIARCAPQEPTASTQEADPAAKAISAETTAWLESVNAVLKRYAGAVGARLIFADCLSRLEQLAPANHSAFVANLAAQLGSPARRAEFLDAIRDAKLSR